MTKKVRTGNLSLDPYEHAIVVEYEVTQMDSETGQVSTTKSPRATVFLGFGILSTIREHSKGPNPLVEFSVLVKWTHTEYSAENTL